ncbi:hypothetical protein HRG_007730 [Hirsutella rhossiliensis]|uniref:Uncharacterized protein n=1 Tax=Hirsutella rhossiliensis TaxID=111463 RepID=A0A9P8MUJ4_9HYPO|nr:uncharacterized protein HRG_07730 [Hirsutella rhossiliensis]KAH0961652.1 hypothetical protein HRG_07730 [Hirsutella rhossiliensis]
MLPNTPKLLKAYGTRVSEVLSSPDINPQGTQEHGPFQAFIGADCTSVWAAATCGPASIGVLLFASMLARAWDASEATAAWVQLVLERQKQVRANIEENRIVHPYSLAAAEQEIGRRELQNWDASARSWLRRADVCMTVSQTQFRLVMDNLAMPYTSSGTDYEKMTTAWIRSMEVVERLLDNLPQQVCDKAVLLAISSWHLYPDLVVFQQEARKIPFKDALFPAAGILSLGLEYKGPSDNVMRWSLALSHLRYYGDPVTVYSNENQSRVQIHQLWLVALGAIFREWGVSYANFDRATGWFRDLHAVLTNPSLQARRPELSFIVRLCSAVASLDKTNPNADGGLIRYGWRRATKFLGGADKMMPSPFFGLCNPHLMDAMTKATDVDCGITYLRGIASQLQLQDHEAIISYTGELEDGPVYEEFATGFPIEWSTGHPFEQAAHGKLKTHVRWLHLDLKGKQMTEALLTQLDQKRRNIEQAGELCYTCREADIPYVVMGAARRYYCRWKNPPGMRGARFPVEFAPVLSLRDEGASGFRLWVTSEYMHYNSPMSRWLMSLRVLEVAQDVYQQLPGATVSLRIVEQDLLKAKWLPPAFQKPLEWDNHSISFARVAGTPASVYLDAMTRAASFACIAMFESGHLNINPEQLNEVIALCSEDSIFVTGLLLSDPCVQGSRSHIRHLVGNVGHSGMVLMVSPLEPRTRTREHNPRLVEHRPYDKAADKFCGTSLHLSFTTWKMPLDWQNTGEIDQQVFLLESVVSVQDNGKWVADIDVIEMEKFCPDVIEKFCGDMNCMSKMVEGLPDLVSIDSWEEFLDNPPCTGVLRARKNWMARLAAAAILVQQGKGHSAAIIGDESICWNCVSNLYSNPEPHLPQIILF